jgi:hypothetical protein
MTKTPAKDVIYIDTDDDITSIIGKVKDAKAKIVALVPPKRVGVLQSAVNLRLLQKAATGADKRVVLITNNHSLIALAAGVKMPVAKNLQSKPEIAQIDALDIDDEDVINGEELPIGEHAKTATGDGDEQPESMNKAAEEAGAALGAAAVADTTKDAAGKPAKKGKGLSVPNFDIFRKRLFLIIGGGVLLVGFLIWAIAIAPRATVTISARTSPVELAEQLTLDPEEEADIDRARLVPLVSQVKKTRDAEFAATGEKEIGERAKGTITIRNCDNPNSFTIGSGTTFRASSGQEFTSDGSVTVPGLSGSSSVCRNTGAGAGTANVSVTAEDIGSNYNIGPSNFAISGIGGDVYAESTSSMSGGSRETVKVVSQSDVDRATEDLEESDDEQIRQELSGQFEGDVIIISESFNGRAGRPNVSPAIGEQASSNARLTVETTYTLLALPRDQVKNLLDDRLNKEIEGEQNRQIYSSGDKNLRFSRFESTSGGRYRVTMHATGHVGPSIDDESLSQELVGKNFGEIEETVNTIDGVDGVDVDFWPFWVNKAPGADKINIRFSVLNET